MLFILLYQTLIINSFVISIKHECVTFCLALLGVTFFFFNHVLPNTKFKYIIFLLLLEITLVDIYCINLDLMLDIFIELLTFSVYIHI